MARRSICTTTSLVLLTLCCFYVGTKQDDVIAAAAGDTASGGQVRMLDERELPPLVPPSFRNTRQLTSRHDFDHEFDPILVGQLTADDVATLRAAGLGFMSSATDNGGYLDEKRTMGMLRMGRRPPSTWGSKRTMGMLRMGRRAEDGLSDEEEEEREELEGENSKRTMSMLRMGRQQASAAEEEVGAPQRKRTMGMLRMGRASGEGKRTMGMLRMGR